MALPVDHERILGDITKRTDTQLIATALASLCDAMKRLERAVASDALDDRAYYLEECAKRRQSAERIIIEKLLKPT